MVIMTIGLTNAQKTKFGIKAGLNAATLTNDNDLITKTSFYVGGLIEIKVTDKFIIQPEVIYSSQGCKFKSDSNIALELDYINIPIMAKYIVAKDFSIEAGPQIGFLTDAIATSGSNSAGFRKFVTTTDLSIGFGAGYDITKHINIGIRYNAGITTVLKNLPISTDVKNSVFQIGAAYKF